MKPNDILSDSLIDEDSKIDSRLRQRISRALRQSGYRQVGLGTDAEVWMRDEGSVAKIIMSGYNQENAIKSALALHDLSRKRPELPNLPRYVKIDGKTAFRFRIEGVPFLQVNMEQLDPLEVGSLNEELIWLFEDYIRKNYDWDRAWESLKKEIDPKFTGLIEKASLSDRKKWKTLYNTLQLLFKVGNKNAFGWDLHTENVMQRPQTGELVVIDPWA